VPAALGLAARLPRLAVAELDPCRPALREAFFDVVLVTAAGNAGRDARTLVRSAAGLLRPGGHLLLLGGEPAHRAGGASGLARVDAAARQVDAAGLELLQSLPDGSGQPVDWPNVELFGSRPRLTALERRLGAWLCGVSYLVAGRRPLPAEGQS
jgi:hypothetical protein